MSVELVDHEVVRRGHLVLAWLGSQRGLGTLQCAVLGDLAGRVGAVLSGDFGMGRCGTVRRLDVPAGPWSSVSAVSLVGDPSRRQVWHAVENALGACTGRVLVTIAAALPEDVGLFEAVFATALLAVSGQRKEGPCPGSFEVLVADGVRAAGMAEGVRTLASAVGRARAWTDAPGNRLGPSAFVEMLREQGGAAGLDVECVGGADLAARGYGGLTAVARASREPGWLVRLDYRPTGVVSAAPSLALVGKGVTFDSGGLSLKTASAMPAMRRDMAGASAVAAVMLALPALRLGYPVRAYLPIAENMPGGAAYRPGDVLELFGGHTVEIDTTDAEGRLILAEAMVTAFEDGAREVVEVSTLCGAGVLGRHVSGVMGEERLVGRLVAAARDAGEDLWPLPLPVEVREGLRSSVADLHQVLPGQERDSPMIQGGAFLSHFVPEGLSWAHIDIGGQVTRPSGTGMTATGVPVRTLLRLLATEDARAADAG